MKEYIIKFKVMSDSGMYDLTVTEFGDSHAHAKHIASKITAPRKAMNCLGDSAVVGNPISVKLKIYK